MNYMVVVHQQQFPLKKEHHQHQHDYHQQQFPVKKEHHQHQHDYHQQQFPVKKQHHQHQHDYHQQQHVSSYCSLVYSALTQMTQR